MPPPRSHALVLLLRKVVVVGRVELSGKGRTGESCRDARLRSLRVPIDWALVTSRWR